MQEAGSESWTGFCYPFPKNKVISMWELVEKWKIYHVQAIIGITKGAHAGIWEVGAFASYCSDPHRSLLMRFRPLLANNCCCQNGKVGAAQSEEAQDTHTSVLTGHGSLSATTPPHSAFRPLPTCPLTKPSPELLKEKDSGKFSASPHTHGAIQHSWVEGSKY